MNQTDGPIPAAGVSGGSAQAAEWRTRVSEIRNDIPFLYGYDLSEALRGEVDFSAIVLLAFTGEMPSRNAARMANAMLVLTAAHAISPSGALAKIFAACGVPMQVAVGASALSMGDFHGGAGEQLAQAFQELDAQAGHDDLRGIAEAVLDRFDAQGERVPGFGHPMHTTGDPRALEFLALASRLEVAGRFCAMAEEVSAALSERKGRKIALNVNGAAAAILSDLGVPWRYMRIFNVTARTPVTGALAAEEIERERRWRMVASDDSVAYDGPPPRPLPAEWRSAPSDGGRT